MKHFGLIIIASLFATGCTTVPERTRQQDAAFKTFTTKPGVANLYVFRDNRFWGWGYGGGPEWNVTLDGHEIERLPARTYLFREVQPGQHRLGRRGSELFINVSGGSNYFVRAGANSLEQVSEKKGRAIVSKLSLPLPDD